MSRAISTRPIARRTPTAGRPVTSRRGAATARRRRGQRVVPRRRLSPARLPRRRHADRRLAHRRRSAERRRHRALPVRRADGQAPDALDASRESPVFSAPARDHREVSRRSAGRSSAGRDDSARDADRDRERRRHADGGGPAAADARHRGARPACRTPTRSRGTSRTSRGSTSPNRASARRASRAVVHRRQAACRCSSSRRTG